VPCRLSLDGRRSRLSPSRSTPSSGVGPGCDQHITSRVHLGRPPERRGIGAMTSVSDPHRCLGARRAIYLTVDMARMVMAGDNKARYPPASRPYRDDRRKRALPWDACRVQRIAALAAEKLPPVVAVNRPRWISPGGPEQLPDDLDDEKYIAIRTRESRSGHGEPSSHVPIIRLPDGPATANKRAPPCQSPKRLPPYR
jgi:hypothetical protein